MNKLNLGAGKNIKAGYINLDFIKGKGIDVVHNLNKFPYPFVSNCFDEIYCGGVLSELDNFLRTMDEIYRISKNKAKITVEESCFGELAFQHPLTKKVFVKDSFNYFPSEYSKSRFKILSRKGFYTHNPNYKFFNHILPARFLRWELEVEK